MSQEAFSTQNKMVPILKSSESRVCLLPCWESTGDGKELVICKLTVYVRMGFYHETLRSMTRPATNWGLHSSTLLTKFVSRKVCLLHKPTT